MHHFEYRQPDFYHFSQTTIEACQWLSQIIFTHNWKVGKIIDCYAGCGVFSMELIARLSNKKLKHIIWIESQREFDSHILYNSVQIKTVYPHLICVLEKMIDHMAFRKYVSKVNLHDLLLMNPAHFYLQEGKRANSDKRTNCLFICRDHWLQSLALIKQLNCKKIFLLKNHTQLFKETYQQLKEKIKIIQPLSGDELVMLC